MRTSSMSVRTGRVVAALAMSVLAPLGAIAGVAAPAAAETAPSINQCLYFQPRLYQGVQNQHLCVAALQSFLHAYYRTGIDGIFGPETDKHVRAFQQRMKISVDGDVGPQTWGAIKAECGRRGDCDYHATF